MSGVKILKTKSGTGDIRELRYKISYRDKNRNIGTRSGSGRGWSTRSGSGRGLSTRSGTGRGWSTRSGSGRGWSTRSDRERRQLPEEGTSVGQNLFG